jgi:putative tryptophan/tyrosine transport system substrate-binding protein
MTADRVTRRRVLLCVIGGSLIAASLGVGAQRTEKVAHIGLLCTVRCEGTGLDALRDGLRSAGWIEGGNLQIEYRAASGQTDRLPALAQELVDLKPDVIVAFSPQPSRAAKNATSAIPIVFIAVADPVRVGLVESLARPGGNVTGVATLVPGGFIAKQLEILKQALPKATRIATLLNPTNDVTRAVFPLEGPPAARQLGVQLQMLEVRAPEGIERAIDAAVQEKADALWVVGDPIFQNPAQRIPDLAARAKLPAMYLLREQVTAGGLISYGPNFIELFRRAAVYVDKILKGAKPADLPVEQPTKFQLVINVKTAKALGITIPQSVLLRADEVIQ